MEDDSNAKLANSLADFVTLRKEQMVATSAPPEKLQYLSMYANLDKMWRKLPEHVVEEINMNTIALTLEELKKPENKMYEVQYV